MNSFDILFFNQLLIGKGASLAAVNSNGLEALLSVSMPTNAASVFIRLVILVFRWTPLMVARSWHRDWLEEVLNPTTDQPQSHPPKSPFSFPLSSSNEHCQDRSVSKNLSPY